MRKLWLGALAAVLVGCPSDKKKAVVPPPAQDTMPMNLDSLQSAIPPAVSDSFTPPPRRAPAERIPPAPPELLAAVQREQSFSKFCYQEFGQKADPTLRGGVAMVVTVDGDGVTGARVANDSWSSDAGSAVNDCLNEKAAGAWKRAAADVKPGKYVVQLSFRPQ
jgi:hypothetical protein